MRAWYVWLGLMVACVGVCAWIWLAGQGDSHNPRPPAALDVPKTNEVALIVAPPPLPAAKGALIPTGAEVRVWLSPGPRLDWATDELAAQGGGRLLLTQFPTEQAYADALAGMATAPQPPDVILVNTRDVSRWLAAGAIRIQPMPKVDEAARFWIPGALEAFRLGDYILASPSDLNPLMLYYNKSLFDRVGCAYPANHWHWGTLTGISRLLTVPPPTDEGITLPDARDAKPAAPHQRGESRAPTGPGSQIRGLAIPWTLPMWEALTQQSGGTLFAPDRFVFGQSNKVKAQGDALRFLAALVKEGVVAPPTAGASAARNEGAAAFLSGQAAMAVAGTELYAALSDQTELRWGVTELPRHTVRATVLSGAGWAVGARAANTDLPWKVARFLSQRPVSARMVPAAIPKPLASAPPAPATDGAAVPLSLASPEVLAPFRESISYGFASRPFTLPMENDTAVIERVITLMRQGGVIDVDEWVGNLANLPPPAPATPPPSPAKTKAAGAGKK